jgi:hypothetical protein
MITTTISSSMSVKPVRLERMSYRGGRVMVSLYEIAKASV